MSEHRKKKDKHGVKRVPSDAPTALIAPSDYQHIYSESKKQPQRTNSAQQVKRVPSNTPTALIAPSDYQHIYSESKKQPQRTTSAQQVKPQPEPASPASPAHTSTNTGHSHQHRPTSPPPERQQTDNILPQSVLDSVERFIKKQPKKYTL